MNRVRGLQMLAGLVLLALLPLQLYQHLSLDYLQQHQQWLSEAAHTSPLQSRLLFFLLYVAASTLSVPGTMLLTLASGAMFGFGWGLLLSSFASSIGALLAFGLSRHVLRKAVQRRFGCQLDLFNRGLQRHGVWYLLSLRLLPVVPYFAINLAMGLSTLRPLTFYWASQLGMLTSTSLYVNAGRQLAQLHSLADLYSPALLTSLALLAALPLAALALQRTLTPRCRSASASAQQNMEQ